MKNKNFIQVLMGFLPYLKKYRPLAFFICFLVVLQAFAARTLPFLIGKSIDEGVVKGNLQIVFQYAFIYLAIQVVASFINFLLHILFQRLGNRILYLLREDLITHVQSLPIKYFDNNPSGRIITRVTNDISSIGGFFNQVLFSISNSIIEVVAIICAMMFISFKLTLASLVLSPLVAWLALKITHVIREVFRRQKQKISAINSFVAENISGISVLHLYNRMSANRNKFNLLSKDYKSESLLMVKNYALLWPLLSTFNATAILFALLYGGYLNTTEFFAIGSLIAFIMNVQDLNEPINNLLEKYVQLQDSIASSERVFDLLSEKTEDLNAAYIAEANVSTPTSYSTLISATTANNPINSHSCNIEIKNLSFRYAENLPWVLKDINIKISSGESIGVVGKTGSGKSTLISILQKFYPYLDGEILINSQHLKNYPSRTWRGQIGVIQQDPFIFRGTVSENISLHHPNISHEVILNAAKHSHCLEIFQRRQNGLETLIEEKGTNLSAGERQLIAFARILAFDPKLLILDEATANIDSFTESLIQESIRQVLKGRTSIIIAHRLSTLHNCDRIVVIDNNQIAEIGTHKELLKLNGIYKKLYQNHFRSSFQDHLSS